MAEDRRFMLARMVVSRNKHRGTGKVVRVTRFSTTPLARPRLPARRPKSAGKVPPACFGHPERERDLTPPRAEDALSGIVKLLLYSNLQIIYLG